MLKFLQSTKCKVILFILALLIGIMIYAVSQGGYTITGIGIFKKIAAPFQSVSNMISEKVEYVLDIYTDADGYYEENQALKAEIAELNASLADYEKTKEELAELQEFVGIKEKHEDFSLTSPCEVIGYVANDPYHAFMIDGGTDNGIHLYDPVVTQQGLVGVVTEVGERTATVTTILSPDVSVSAGCIRTGEMGVISGSVSLSREGMCKLSYLNKEPRMKKDNVIITLGESGTFPKGYVIGYVREIHVDESGMTSYAAVEPAVDVTNLKTVVVVTDFDGKETQDDAS